MRQAARVLALGVAALAVLLPLPARAQEIDLARAFESTASGDGDLYAVGRAALLAAGARGVEVARRYAGDADPGRRALAALLILRHEHAEEFDARAAVLRQGYAHLDATQAASGRVVVRHQPSLDPSRPRETKDVVFLPRHAPLAIDALRDRANWIAAAEVAGALRVADAAPSLVRLLPTEQSRASIAGALAAIGAPALPALRAALEEPPPGQRSSYGLVPAVAPILAAMEDRAAAPALRRRLVATRDESSLLACARALAVLDPAGGTEAALARWLAYSDESRRTASSNLGYGEFREAVRAFGDAAAATCSDRLLANPQDPIVAARLRGFVWEREHPEAAAAAYRDCARTRPWFLVRDRLGDEDPVAAAAAAEETGRRIFWVREVGDALPTDVPVRLAAERATVDGRPEDLLAVAASADPERVPLLRAILLGPLRGGGGATALEALAAIDAGAACDVVDAGATEPPPADFAERVAALLGRLDVPRVAKTFETIASRSVVPHRQGSDQWDAAIHLAKAALAVARGERKFADLLGHDDPGVRLTVARVLARRGDAAGVSIVAAALFAASAFEFEGLRDELVRAGLPPDAAPDDVRARVLRDSVAARIADPARARAFDAARIRRRPYVVTVIGPQPRDFEIAGERLAADVGAAARPLLEEAAVFLADLPSIHALGVLGDERSIPVLTFVARTLHAPAAAALRRMGEKGLAAAEALPPPDPAKARYGERATRHLAGAEALDGTPAGIAKALEGLAEPLPAEPRDREAWSARMQRYLGLLAPVGDARVLEPALRILDAATRREDRLVDAALLAMEKVRDPRVVEACLKFLPAHPFDGDRRDWGPTLGVLQSQLGDRTCDVLAERHRDAPPGRSRNAFAHALFRAAAHRPQRDAAAAALRTQLGEVDDSLASGSAFDLVRLHFNRPVEERAAADLDAVLAFVRTHAVPGLVADELGKHNAPGAGDALLACYVLGGDSRAARALGALRHEPAVPALRTKLGERLADGKRPFGHLTPPEVAALAAIGGEGAVHLRTLLEDRRAGVRPVVAHALAAVGDPAAFDPLLALLDENDRGPDPASSDASERRRHDAWALARIDPERARIELSRRALAATDPAVAKSYAEAALRAKDAKPASRDRR